MILSFTIDGALFGFRAEAIGEIVKLRGITPVPLCNHGVAGLAVVRGRIATVRDLAVTVGLTPTTLKPEMLGVIAEHHGDMQAFLVDGINGILLDDQDLLALPGFEAWHVFAEGAVQDGDSRITVLNVASLLERIAS